MADKSPTSPDGFPIQTQSCLRDLALTLESSLPKGWQQEIAFRMTSAWYA